MEHIKRKTAVAGIVALAAFAQPLMAGELTLYTSLEEDEVVAYLDAAKAALPDIEINVLRLSTGDMGARLIAEEGNPQADVIWGFAVTNMLDSRISGQLEAYAPAGIDALSGKFRDPDGKWFATMGYMGAFCVNKPAMEAKNLPIPTSWADLTNPVYKGEIVMPNPASSGTGYLQVAAIVQGGGEEGWKLIGELDKNMAQYTSSGSKPCKMARAGEYAIGASFSFVAMQSVEAGFPIEMVIPSDYAGYELEASGLMSSSDNKEDAKKFLDWTLSADAANVYSNFKAIVTVPGATRSPAADAAGLPSNLAEVLYPVDFAASAASREATLKRWKETTSQ
jgi:iron(III) transport system substrate-binding protein